jgi:hypothetical protein
MKGPNADIATLIGANLVFGIPLIVDIVSLPFLLLYDSVVPKETTYSYETYTKIKGRLVDKNKEPISNKKININLKDEAYSNNAFSEDEIVYSDKNGFFVSEMSRNEQYLNTIVLNFNDGKDSFTFNGNLQKGADVTVYNPHEVSYTYPFEKGKRTIFYLEGDNICKKNKDIKLNKIILLDKKTFSAKQYRDKIEKEEKIEQAKEMFKNADIDVDISTVEMAILDENGDLKENWENIVKEQIQNEIVSSIPDKVKNSESSIAADEMLEEMKNKYVSYPKVQRTIKKEKAKLKEKLKIEKRYLNKAKRIFEALEKNAFYIMNGNKTIESVIISTIGKPLQVFDIVMPPLLRSYYGPSRYKILLYEKTVIRGNLAPKQFYTVPFRVEIPIYTIGDNINYLSEEMFFNRQLEYLNIYNFEDKYNREEEKFEFDKSSAWSYW